MNCGLTLLLMSMAELLRYDIMLRLFGFRYIHRDTVGSRTSRAGRSLTVKQLCNAMECATALYWKPVRCLQRSVVLVRLLRRHGWEGHLVIGYRPSPFFSHAWAEVDGLLVGDSAAYKARLRVLEMV